MEKLLFILLLMVYSLRITATDIPNILILGDDVSEELATLLKKDLASGLIFTGEDMKSNQFVCNWRCFDTGSAGILDFLEKYRNPAKARVLLLNSGIKDIQRYTGESYKSAYRTNLVRILARAKKLGLETLWYDTPPSPDANLNEDIIAYNHIAREVMSENKAYTIAYYSFWEGMVKDSVRFKNEFYKVADQKKSEYLAESLTQWWTAAAKSNRSIERIRMWEGSPPYYEYLQDEHISASARIADISMPELERFLPQKRKNAPAVVFFPGGGYQQTGFLRNARELAEILNPHGIAVIGLKYRTKRPLEVPLADAQRAVRYVRDHAKEWGIDPNRIGIAGQSAGANLALNLCCIYTTGDAGSNDPVERASSRPDFVVLLTSWNFLSQEYPFEFRPDLPPFFVRHARDDNSFQLAEHIVVRLQESNTPVNVLFLEKGGHGAFEIKDTNTGYTWPADFVKWLQEDNTYPIMTTGYFNLK